MLQRDHPNPLGAFLSSDSTTRHVNEKKENRKIINYTLEKRVPLVHNCFNNVSRVFRKLFKKTAFGDPSIHNIVRNRIGPGLNEPSVANEF